MKNHFETVVDNLENGESLTIGEQTFVDEIVSNETIQCSLLGTISFCKIDFENVDFTGSTFVNCKFQNCTFVGVTFRKCDFFNTIFENSVMKTSNFTKASFHEGKFYNCNFWRVDLTTAYFDDFEFSDTKLSESKLDLIVADSVKVTNLVQRSRDFGKFLEGSTANLNLLLLERAIIAERENIVERD